MTHQRARGLFRVLAACPLAIAAATLAGCWGGDSRCVDLRGEVTWKGKPVPAGYVVFSPDPKKGNSGPQGTAAIIDGKYDTRGANGRPVVRGPVVVTINGFDGLNPTEDRPRGSRLFLPCELPIDVPDSPGELNIEVPNTTIPYRPSGG
ncbi:MAG: hypothetical protein JW818_11670 [Pirellulales bacterium]|nr:hypothetical protein [Pirellulales bacterium]